VSAGPADRAGTGGPLPRSAPVGVVAAVLLHPLHAVLGGLVAGLLAGPRAPVVVALLVAGVLLAGSVRVRGGRALADAADERGGRHALVGATPARVRGVRLVVDHGPDAVPFRRRVRGAREVSVVAVPVPVRAPLLGLLVALGVVVGAAGAQERLRALDRTALVPGTATTVRGHLAEAPRTRARGVRVAPLELVEGPGRGERVLVRVPARLAWPDGAGIGDEVVVRGRLRALDPFEGFERRRGVHAVVEARSLTAHRAAAPLARRRRPPSRRARARRRPRARARRPRARDGPRAGRGPARRPARRVPRRRPRAPARRVGAERDAPRRARARVAAALGVGRQGRLALALAAIAVYVPLAGAGPSIQRAGVMGAAGLVAALAGRAASRWYAVLLAAAVTLALSPRAAEDPGWQLSFAAVVAILAGHRGLRRWLVARRVPAALADAAALTTAATLGTAPLLALHFEQVSLVSLPANLLAAPAVAPVMWLGTLAALVGGPPATALNALAAFPLAYLAWLGRAAAAVPHASVTASLPGPVAAAALYAAMAAVFLARHRVRGLLARARSAGLGRRAARHREGRHAHGAGADERDAGRDVREARHARAATADGGDDGRGGVAVRAAAVAALAVAALVLVTRPVLPAAPDGPAISVLDVGQGDAVLLQDGARAVLVDTGPPGSRLLGELRRLGVRRVDALVVTHSSADHEGGLAAVLGAMPVGLVLDGRQTAVEQRAAPDGGEGGGHRFAGLPQAVPRAVPEAGQVVRAGSIALRVLWPPAGRSRAGDPNRTATVALAQVGPMTALLTADAESAVTLPLDLPAVDVLKVAHHGSDDPGLPALLARVRPRAAVVPVGRNTYGHPTPATLGALRAVPSVRRTDRDGTVTLTPRDLPPAGGTG
jgi:competence protein ComEC